MKNQLIFIRNLLERDGKVSRNQALQNFITRLGAIIFKLKAQGYEIEGKWEGKDFVYYMKNQIHHVARYILRDGDRVVGSYQTTTYEKAR